jgi:hypothetical protein
MLEAMSTRPVQPSSPASSRTRGVISGVSSSPSANQVPLRVVFLWTSPGVKISADSSTTQPTVRSRPTIEAIESSFMPFCTPTTTPSAASHGTISSAIQRWS